MKIVQCCAGGLYSSAIREKLEELGHDVIPIDISDDIGIPHVVVKKNELINFLEKIGIGKGDVVVLPHNQEEVRAISMAGGKGNGWKAMVPPPVSFERTVNKLNFYSDLERFNIGFPRFIRCGSLAAYPRSELGWLAKPVEGCGSSGIVSPETLKNEYLCCERFSGKEFTIDALCLDGRVVDYCVRERLRAHGGICVDARVLGNVFEIGEPLRDMVSCFSLNGPLAVQGFLVEGKFFFTDCNHRFGGGAIFSIMAGWKGLENWCRILEGREPVKSEIRQCRIRREYKEIEADEK